MNAQESFPDVISSLLAGFSPYIERVVLDLSTNSIEFQLLDQVESPTTLRILRFERLQNLQITPHDPEDADPLFIDSIIGAHREDMAFLLPHRPVCHLPSLRRPRRVRPCRLTTRSSEQRLAFSPILFIMLFLASLCR